MNTGDFPHHPVADTAAHRAALQAAVLRVLDSGLFLLGPETAAFEKEFSAWMGGGETIGVGNGTDALTLALLACGIRPGDLVATVAHTASATVAAIEAAGARPWLIDVTADGFTLDPARLENALLLARPHTPRAIIPVHLYGHLADMPAILAIARRHGALVIEDCAQAAGARLHGTLAGTFGDAAAFSFYPTKTLAAAGDAGAIFTRDPALAARARRLRQYGWDEHRVCRDSGRNSRLDEIQAAILRVKLPAVEAALATRASLAALYDRHLAGLPGLVLPPKNPAEQPAFQHYVVRNVHRDSLRARLEAAGIPAAIHYPVPAHLHPAFQTPRVLLDPAGLARSEALAATVLSLPLHARLTPAAVTRTCAAIRAACQTGSPPPTP